MTKHMETVLLLTVVVCATVFTPAPVLAQGCGDDEAMVESYVKDLNDLVATTRKESLEEFEKAYHQRTCLSKLNLSLNLVKELEDCLEKAASDSSATQEQTDKTRAEHEKYSKLESKISQDRRDLKGAQDSKEAKALIAKFDLSN